MGSKMRPDMMVAEMTATELSIYFPQAVETVTGAELPKLLATMSNWAAMKVTIDEGGYCSNASYLGKFKEIRQQHTALQDTGKAY